MNRRVFEALKRKGECWHEEVGGEQGIHTCSCGMRSFDYYVFLIHLKNTDFSTWEGFGWAWERLDKKVFIKWFCNQCSTLCNMDAWIFWESLTIKEKMEALDQFLKWKEVHNEH
jgi:hypothetical protein